MEGSYQSKRTGVAPEDRGGATAGGFDAVAGGGQLRDDAAARRTGGADDESGAHRGHRLIAREVSAGFDDGEGVPVIPVGGEVPVPNGDDGDIGHVERAVGLHQAADAAHLDHDGLRVGGLVDPQVGKVMQVDVVGVVTHVGGDGLLAIQPSGPAFGGKRELHDAVLGPQADPAGNVLVQ